MPKPREAVDSTPTERYGVRIKHLSKAELLERLEKGKEHGESFVVGYNPDLIGEETIISPIGEPLQAGCYYLRVNRIVEGEGETEEFTAVEVPVGGGINFLTEAVVDLEDHPNLMANIYYPREVAENLGYYEKATPLVHSPEGLERMSPDDYKQGLVGMGHVNPGFTGRLVLEMGNISQEPLLVKDGDVLGLLVFIEGEENMERYDGKYQGQYK